MISSLCSQGRQLRKEQEKATEESMILVQEHVTSTIRGSNRSLPSWTLRAVSWQMCHVWITDWIVSGSVEATHRPSYTKEKSTILHVFMGFMAALPCLEHLQDVL